ncbi:MAG: pantoate--beta-alanine ligase [Bacteriovoracaceae bacterium]|nr:pantoate--beta-alanine ligase [Bacteriovoracaceae bacterium]
MLKTFTTTTELLKTLAQLNTSYGLVPTMGNLHQGHLSLIQNCLNNADTCVVSIFVNPKQFAPHEDFNEYPRTLLQDQKLIEGLLKKNPQKNIFIFAPQDSQEIFPLNHVDFKMDLGIEEKILCGKSRPTHFAGVIAVVHRLFEIIKPTSAYFGQKDFQQLFFIKKMIAEMKLPLTLHPCPIIRDKDGLALSSRNQYLSDEERREALHLPKTLHDLSKAHKKLEQTEIFIHRIKEQNKAWDYLEILNSETLKKPTHENEPLILLGAYFVGKRPTRLIDNVIVSKMGKK